MPVPKGALPGWRFLGLVGLGINSGNIGIGHSMSFDDRAVRNGHYITRIQVSRPKAAKVEVSMGISRLGSAEYLDPAVFDGQCDGCSRPPAVP